MKKRNNKNNNVIYKLKRRLSKTKDALFGDVDEENNSFTIFEVVIIVIISILFGALLGYTITYTNLPSSKKDAGVREIISTYNTIVENYYGDIDESKLTDAAVKGMIDSLGDPNSNYMNESQTSEFNESVDGSFVGIGVVVLQQDGKKIVIDVKDNSPAKKVGIQKDDVIIKVDDIDVTEMDSKSFVGMVKGKKGSNVKITILRKDEEKSFNLVRNDVELEVVTGKVIKSDDIDVGYIRITSFTSNSYKQFKKVLTSLENKKISGLIVDLRNNHGGHLEQTTDMLSLFFNKKTVLYQIESKKSSRKKIYSRSKVSRKYPVAILINGGSASASEIFASCFKENYKNSFIIGTTSYGKGTVQQSQSLSNGTSIKFTTQRWLTAKGKWLNEKGVKPDIEIEQSDEYYENPSDDLDTLLQEALKQVKESI